MHQIWKKRTKEKKNLRRVTMVVEKKHYWNVEYKKKHDPTF